MKTERQSFIDLITRKPRATLIHARTVMTQSKLILNQIILFNSEFISCENLSKSNKLIMCRY